MVLCAVCRRAEASQDHHIIYEPFSIKIGVCKKCHYEIHGKNLGAPKRPRPKENIRAIRGVPDELWKMVKIRATMEDITIAEFLSKSMAHYLSKQSNISGVEE